MAISCERRRVLQVRFCGADCQKKAWKPWHKAECQAYQQKRKDQGSSSAGSSSTPA